MRAASGGRDETTSKTWPFEGQPDPTPRIRTPDDFIAQRGDGCEAVVVRIGFHDAQLVLVDSDGAWERWVYPSLEQTTAVAEDLGVPVHVGEYPEGLRVRINSYRPPAEAYDRAAYPEQGRVGPVIPYPENRPRRPDALQKEVAAEPHPQPPAE